MNRLKEYDPEANIYFTLDPDSKEGYIISEINTLSPSLLMCVLSKRGT